MTSFGSEIKGSLNDSNLQIVGFGNYNMEYETFALTRLIYYVMTGRYNLENIKKELHILCLWKENIKKNWKNESKPFLHCFSKIHSTEHMSCAKGHLC